MSRLIRWLGRWHRLSLVRRGHLVHATWDRACRWYEPIRPGTRFDLESRGVCCRRCGA